MKKELSDCFPQASVMLSQEQGFHIVSNIYPLDTIALGRSFSHQSLGHTHASH